ncbi:transcription factor bHLH30-like [Tasmannia lanceolata]|uniref:transcription factor bHLH30-like n=1 Tax=Tasmannia lanceolata TaxID=3420 RepID=UPI00406316AB
MIPFRSYYGFGRTEGFYQSFGGSMELDGGSRSTAEKKAVSASKSHSEAERRRRERINGHLNTLRTLLPNTNKTDKASLLAEVVQRVKDLKRHAADVAADVASFDNNKTQSPLPGEIDEVTLDSDPRSSLIKASVCCDDRPDLLSDLNYAIRSLQLRPVKAEIATLGGRTKTVFIVEGKGGHAAGDFFPALRRALKAVLEKPAVDVAGAPATDNKRPRLSRYLTDDN